MTILACTQPNCTNPIPGKSGRGVRPKYCSDICRKVARKEQRLAYGADSHTETCGADECDRPLRAKGLCNMHYRQVLRDEGRITPDPWSDRRRDAHHARRAKMAGAKNGDKVMLAAVRERDKGMCGICGAPVDAVLEYPEPLSSSLDHVIPIIRGGEHSMANCQLAHLVCNLRKSDSLPD